MLDHGETSDNCKKVNTDCTSEWGYKAGCIKVSQCIAVQYDIQKKMDNIFHYPFKHSYYGKYWLIGFGGLNQGIIYPSRSMMFDDIEIKYEMLIYKK